MSAKYYTRFRLRVDGSISTDEYSGVVELSRRVERSLDHEEIEALLARNLELEEESVELLNWSPLH